MIFINLFKKFFSRIDNWIGEGSGWITESIDALYVNIPICSPLSRSSYIKLPDKLKNKYLNPLKIHSERTT